MAKTTVLLRDGVHDFLINKFGKRGISKTINDILFKELIIKKKKDMFGADKWLKKAGLKELREHHERSDVL